MPFFNIFSEKTLPVEETIKIIVDNREKNSLLASELIKRGVQVTFEQLAVADYLVNGVAIERKTVSDLKSSIINKRIMAQLQDLKQHDKYLLIVEGGLEENLYQGQIHENALRGFLLSVVLNYQVPLIFTQNIPDTAKYLLTLAKKQRSQIALRPSKIALTKKEQLQFILEGFPNIGPAKAKALLSRFCSLKNIINASEEDLKPLLGSRSKHFFDLINKDTD